VRLILVTSLDKFIDISAVGVFVPSPFLGKLADSTGPRICLSIAFVLLLTGYLGIMGVYDAFQDNLEPVGGGTLFKVMLSELITGIGSTAGYSASLNVVVKSFPDKIVSSTPESVTLTMLTLLSNIEDDRVGFLPCRCRIIGFLFFRDRTRVLSWKYFWSPAHSGHRDVLPDGTWLVFGSPLPTL
jgi:MFS family permease